MWQLQGKTSILSFTLAIEVNGKEIPMGTRNEDVWGFVCLFVWQGKHITLTVFTWLATFESHKLKEHSLFFSPFAFSSPWLVLWENIKVVPQLSQAGQCPDRKQSCRGGQMGFDVL